MPTSNQFLTIGGDDSTCSINFSTIVGRSIRASPSKGGKEEF